jgi:hypothetical protein
MARGSSLSWLVLVDLSSCRTPRWRRPVVCDTEPSRVPASAKDRSSRSAGSQE